MSGTPEAHEELKQPSFMELPQQGLAGMHPAAYGRGPLGYPGQQHVSQYDPAHANRTLSYHFPSMHGPLQNTYSGYPPLGPYHTPPCPSPPIREDGKSGRLPSSAGIKSVSPPPRPTSGLPRLSRLSPERPLIVLYLSRIN